MNSILDSKVPAADSQEETTLEQLEDQLKELHKKAYNLELMLVYFKKKCQANTIQRQNVLWKPIKLQEL